MVIIVNPPARLTAAACVLKHQMFSCLLSLDAPPHNLLQTQTTTCIQQTQCALTILTDHAHPTIDSIILIIQYSHPHAPAADPTFYGSLQGAAPDTHALLHLSALTLFPAHTLAVPPPGGGGAAAAGGGAGAGVPAAQFSDVAQRVRS